ncbi:MAG: diguanylate cyclase, partial [Campylobacterota bacterium]|nr:diguanylate cyclase [Campylobacterota bacterium]
VNKVVSKTLLYFKETQETMTPDLYAKNFCEFAKKEKLVFEECNKIEAHSKKLNPDIAKLISGYSIKTLDEFIYFLIIQLNRSEKSKNKALTSSLEKLIFTLLKTIKLLHNAKAFKISDFALGLDIKQQNHLDTITEKFKEFNESYNQSFLEKLNKFGIFTKNDFPTLVDELIKEVEQKGDIETSDELVKILILSLSPSLATTVNDKVAKLEEQLAESPNLITSKEVQKELKESILKRIDDDKSILRENLKNTNLVIDSLLEKITTLIFASQEKSEGVVRIKESLRTIDFKNSDVHGVQKKLIDISEQIENNLDGFLKSLNKEHNETEILKKRITELEEQLNTARKEADEDFLTMTMSRRSLSSHLELFEKEYKEKNINYSIIFFDIDYFKKVNDIYGHLAGDKILSAVGKFLNSHIAKDEIVGRYGGEEFIIISKNDNFNELFNFTDSLREKIENTKFKHQKDEIKITCSAGIAIRSEQKSQDLTVKTADKMLYEAKKAGRNIVLPKP